MNAINDTCHVFKISIILHIDTDYFTRKFTLSDSISFNIIR